MFDRMPLDAGGDGPQRQHFAGGSERDRRLGHAEYGAAGLVLRDGVKAAVPQGQEANADLYASADYRRHLARIWAARALTVALSRAS